ncbi:MAG: insulinase family protein [Tannerella sp.]|jgi:predicted Zn-dependent peptidase|nr:insulinase family protein [Tannerella sp.]
MLFYHSLNNGLRIVHLQTASKVAYCGFAVNAGSRDEQHDEHGFAHFVEHSLFKGTAKRKSWHIINRMENVGGELNAYTSKEETLVYCIFMEQDFNRAAELLSDLVINSQFPENELAKEREVIIEEIQSYEDNPSELIYDDFENMLFEGHALGHHILGNKKSLKSFTSTSGRSFLEHYYTSDNMIFFSVSSTDSKTVRRTAEKYFSDIPKSHSLTKREIPKESLPPFQSIKKRKTHLSHVIIGNRACNMYEEKKYPLLLLNNILGGPGMNSRLNISLREKRGLVYTIESNITSYTDTGVFCIYFGIDHKNCEQAIEIVNKELYNICNKKLTETQLNRAKKQAIGQTGVATDNKESMSLGLGKAFLHFNRYQLPEETFRKIKAITSQQIIEIANEILIPDKLSLLIFE